MFRKLRKQFLKYFSRTTSGTQEAERSTDTTDDDDKRRTLEPGEIELIRSTWRQMRRDISKFKMNGAELFIKFFTKYPDFQRQFPSFKDIPLYSAPGAEPIFTRAGRASPSPMRINKKLLAHGTYVMYTLGMLVDHLEEPELLAQMLQRLARNHYRRRISITAFELLRDTFLQHLVDQLGPVVADRRALVAWDKAFGYMLTVLDEEFNRLEADFSSTKTGSYYQLDKVHQLAQTQFELKRQQRQQLFRATSTSLLRDTSRPTSIMADERKTTLGGRRLSNIFSGHLWTTTTTTTPNNKMDGERETI